ncbi:hypothetical protein Drose_33985 [Dactylosporangium roseum]|uniref:Uncharacterized protein n=1 Tax=Dactylosporangium roseum TaxID=47989 RepID=A0ABY5Z2K0_9ACTN|nr:hypothetical protein [Dactylosporangium roseum]UWZ36032.1 hypothetical protein Drose_33985 [Dactylosporangium roseum]
MTSGNEPRRKRRADSFRRDEADEADNWLAGLRGTGRGEPDPFAAPPPEPAPFDSPAFDPPPFDRGAFPPAPGGQDGPGRSGGRRSRDREESPSGGFGRADSPSGVFSPASLPPAPPPARPALPDATEMIGGRRRARDDDSPSGTFGRTESPSGTFGRAVPPPARPPLGEQLPTAPAEARGGRRRARDDEPIGRRQAGPSESYDHGPELTPIIKPLADLVAQQPTTDPPPLVPIFPTMRPDATPTSGGTTGRRARREAEEAENPRTGEVGERRRARSDDSGSFRTGSDSFRTGNGYEATGGNGFDTAGRPEATTAFRAGETTAFRAGDDIGVRRQRTGLGEDTGSRRPGDPGAPHRSRGYDAEGPAGFRRDDTGTGRLGRAGAPAAGATPADLTAPRRRADAPRVPIGDDAPHQRRTLDDAMPGRGYDDPSTARRRGGRGTGEYSGDYIGGGQRALREPPGGRPVGPPGRGERPGRPGRGGTGSHPRAVIDPVRPEHRPHRWIAMLSVIAVVVVLGACGIGTWFILKDERNGPESARSSTTSGPKKRDISSRQVDPAPLTEAEVFPSNNIVAVPNEPPYVILSTKASPDCKTAATDELATLLMNAGCSEVVRATMKSPNEEYLITAGIFNLDTEKAAALAFDGVKPIVDGQKGRFSGMSVGAGTGTDALVRAPTQLGWNYKGHFIAYCVIARVDGNAFAPVDPYPQQITFDIVETYLENEIIGNRAVVQPEATPAASLPASPAPGAS